MRMKAARSTLAAGMFALGLDAYIVAGLLPGIEKSFDASSSTAGLAVAAFTLCYAASAPISAALFAGRPIRTVLGCAATIFLIANVASALAPNFVVFLLSRCLAGAGAGLFSPTATAAAALLTDDASRGRNLGFVLAGMSLGTVVGVPSGLAFAAHVGWRGAFWTIVGLSACNLCALGLFAPKLPQRSPPSLRQRLTLLNDGAVLGVVAVTFLIGVASLGLYTYVAILASAFGQVDHLPRLLWAWGLGGLIGSFSIGRIVDAVRRPGRIIAVIAFLLGMTFLFLPFLLRFPFLALFGFCAWGALGWASQAPQQHALLKIRPNDGAIAVALNSSVNYLGSSVGALIGGGFVHAGMSAADLPLAAAVGAFAALTLRLSASRRPSSAPDLQEAGP